MQVNKYKLGEIEFSYTYTLSDESVYRSSELPTGGTVIMFEKDIVKMGATPLIESKPGVLQKLGKEAVLEVDFANTPDEKPWYRDLFVINRKINELVDAVNALQKGK